ncbi:MAG: WHG domain-containing protein [Clostridium sp.]|uniref:TetR/AcrR family transcriptional regulator n=1 Tax=Clostridium sp. TaxID=1506 RepID=UPI0039EB9532
MSPRIGITLDTILKAAVEIADTKGIYEVTLASLAEKLNIRTPSLYNHVNGLSELRRKLAIYGMEQLYNALTLAATGRSGDDAVRALGEAYVTFARNHKGLYEATFLNFDTKDTEIQIAADQIVSLSIRVLHAFGLEEQAAIHVTRGLRSIFHGFVSLEQKGGFGLPVNTDESFRLLIDTYLAGLHCKNQDD